MPMREKLWAIVVVLTVVLVASSVQSLAQQPSTAVPPSTSPCASAKYQLMEAKEGWFRIDTQTGLTWVWLPVKQPEGVKQFGTWIPVGER